MVLLTGRVDLSSMEAVLLIHITQRIHHASQPEWIFKPKHVLESRGHALESIPWEHVPETAP